MKWQKYLRDVYTDLSRGGSFQSVDKLYHTIQKEGKLKIKREDVLNFLQGQDTYTMHKEVRRKFPTNYFEVADINTVWQADLADLSKYESENDGYRYILGCIDTFSRRLHLRPLKTKAGKEIVKQLQDIFHQLGQEPRSILSDRGSEFTNNTVSEFLKAKQIGHIYTSNMSQAAMIERVWKTIKLRMVKFFELTETTRYIDHLHNLEKGYNNTYHSAIGMTPMEVTPETFMQAEYNQLVNRRKRSSPGSLPRKKSNSVYRMKDLVDPMLKKKPAYKFEIGTHVRLSLRPEKISSEYKHKWTREIYQVASRRNRDGIAVYKVKDLQGEVLHGTFYTQELQEVHPDPKDKSYEIEKVLKERTTVDKKGKEQKEYLVKFLGYPKKFNQWISEAAFTRK